MLVGVCSTLNCDSYCFKTHYAYSLAFDPSIGMVPSSTSLEPDFFLKNPNMLKAGKHDKDSPGIVETLTGPYRNEFLDAMKLEIEELENHNTWTIMKRCDIPEEKLPDGSSANPKVLLGTWVFKIKRFPSGMMRKIKARFCARGDLQEDVDTFDTYAPVASWKAIRMLTTTAMQQN